MRQTKQFPSLGRNGIRKSTGFVSMNSIKNPDKVLKTCQDFFIPETARLEIMWFCVFPFVDIEIIAYQNFISSNLVFADV